MIRRSWTQAASIERRLRCGLRRFRSLRSGYVHCSGRNGFARNAGLFLEGLLGDEQRKTGWMRAEAAGDPGPWRQQAILGRRDWDADALRDIVRDYVIEHLADDDAVLVIDETGFLKQGNASCGVARQYTGSAGKITNCQIGVFATYVSRHGHAFIDRALYLPKEWTDDPDRLQATYVPAGTGFATNQKLATRNDRTRDSRGCAIQVGSCRYGLRCRRYRAATTPGRQRLCARGQQRLMVFRSWGKRRSVSGNRRGHRIDAASIRLENACPQGTEPKDRGCMIGAISNWPISMPASSTTQ